MQIQIQIQDPVPKHSLNGNTTRFSSKYNTLQDLRQPWSGQTNAGGFFKSMYLSNTARLHPAQPQSISQGAIRDLDRHGGCWWMSQKQQSASHNGVCDA